MEKNKGNRKKIILNFYCGKITRRLRLCLCRPHVMGCVYAADRKKEMPHPKQQNKKKCICEFGSVLCFRKIESN